MNEDNLRYFFSICELLSEQSKCKKLRVGAVIVRNERIIVASGYNRVISACNCCARSGCASGEKQELCNAIHAEQNAIGFCARLGIKIEGCDLICTHKPCPICEKLIKWAGIRNIYYKNDYPVKNLCE